MNPNVENVEKRQLVDFNLTDNSNNYDIDSLFFFENMNNLIFSTIELSIILKLELFFLETTLFIICSLCIFTFCMLLFALIDID